MPDASALRPALAFALTRLSPVWEVPAGAHPRTVTLHQLLGREALRGAIELHIHSMMTDLEWLLDTCPAIEEVPRVCLVHGSEDVKLTPRSRHPRYLLFDPPRETFGSYHSKMVIVRKRDELAVHVVTANFIFADWNNKTNGVWSGHFPVRHSSEATVQASSSTAPTATKPTRETHGANEEHIGADLYRYYQALQALGSSPPTSFRLSSGRAPTAADAAGWSRLRFDWILHYDFRSAHTARIVASVPGRSAGRHKANDLEKWGHMRVRALLAKHPLPPKFDDAPLVMQFSSLSSVGTDDKWLRELVASFCGDGRCPLRIVFPTEDQVRDSLEGWPAGASIPCTDENACKLSNAIRQYGGGTALAQMCKVIRLRSVCVQCASGSSLAHGLGHYRCNLWDAGNFPMHIQLRSKLHIRKVVRACVLECACEKRY
uniref:PLD phosphodiesterase domain-containing protein n=1 Tax=Chrysotila carterae TaxID=13221 RepID=A0A7S4F9F4_CHRCT